VSCRNFHIPPANSNRNWGMNGVGTRVQNGNNPGEIEHEHTCTYLQPAAMLEFGSLRNLFNLLAIPRHWNLRFPIRILDRFTPHCHRYFYCNAAIMQNDMGNRPAMRNTLSHFLRKTHLRLEKLKKSHLSMRGGKPETWLIDTCKTNRCLLILPIYKDFPGALRALTSKSQIGKTETANDSELNGAEPIPN